MNEPEDTIGEPHRLAVALPLAACGFSVSPLLLLRVWLPFGFCALLIAAFLFCLKFHLGPLGVVFAPILILFSFPVSARLQDDLGTMLRRRGPTT